MNHPDPLKHRTISLVKSAVRCFSSIGACCLLGSGASQIAIGVLALGYGVAEIVGVVEELV